ncbi:uncharacterized protein [Hetaerina americana]|uniref:uncharacterized protein n=1 Tax=Hetaerina americana TaxID=62018 RepID=UPI003A7F3260
MNSAITFTKELEKDGRLPFLDVLVTRKLDGTLGHSVYRKPKHTDRYLHATSNHHPQQKAGVIKTLFSRAERVSDAESLPAEKKHLNRAMRNNAYDNAFIRRAVRKREPDNKRKEKPAAFALLPYVKCTTDRITRILSKENVVTRFGTVKKLKDIFPSAKYRLPPLLTERVYKVTCSCGGSYVGQTERAIETLIKEHKTSVKNKQRRRSAVAGHIMSEPGHKIDFEYTKALAKKQY